MNELHDQIIALLPATMRQLEAATGLPSQPVWDAVHTMRRAGIIRRVGPHGARVFELVTPPKEQEPVGEAADPVTAADASVSPGAASKEEKKKRKRPVILCWITDWPSQDPGRRMVWKIVWNGVPTAERELKHLQKRLGKEANFEIVSMTPQQARRLRIKGYSITEVLERERAKWAKDAPAGS